MKISNLFLLAGLLGLSCMRLSHSDTAYSSCYKSLSDADKNIAQATQEKIVKSSNPDFPKSLRASSLVHRASKEKEPPVEVGCVALKFNITEGGKVEDVEVLESIPEKIFVRSSLHAIKRFQFLEESGVGVYVFNYQVKD